MRISEEVLIRGDAEAIWLALRDVDLVAKCVPGASLDRDDGDGTYWGVIAIKFGPTTVRFAGSADIVHQDGDRVVSIRARGRDGRGRSRAETTVAISFYESPSGARLTFDGDFDVEGPLRQFATTGGVSLVGGLLKEFAECIEFAIERRLNDGVVDDVDKPGWTEVSETTDCQNSGAPSVSAMRLLWRGTVQWIRRQWGKNRKVKEDR